MFLEKSGRNAKHALLSLIILLTLAAHSNALSIGTAPGVADLGEVNPGDNIDFSFYMVSNTESDLLVELGPVRPHLTLFETNQTGRYKFIPAQASNIYVENWVEVKRTPVLVSPSKTKLIKLADGGIIRANGEADITLHVPKDAEPCYFISSINPAPIVNPTGVPGGSAVSTIGITRFVFVFKVKGDGRREGEVVDIMPFREKKDSVRFDVLFRNTGTCSILAWVQNLTIYSENGSRVADVMSGNSLIPPGKIGVLTTRWVGQNIKEGDYRAEAKVEFFTGSAFYEKQVTILKPPLIPVGGASETPGKCSYPWWILIVLFAILLLFYVLDRMDALLVKVIIGLAVIVTIIGALTCFSSIPWTWFLLLLVVILLYVYLRG